MTLHHSTRIAILAIAALALTRASLPQALTTVPIVDPSYNMKAFDITIPANWKFQGTVIPGPNCNRIPFPVFRAYSRDGLTEIRLMPAFNWTFHPAMTSFHGIAGCLNYPGTMTATQFLDNFEEMLGTNGMHVIGPMPVGSAYEQRVAQVAYNMSHMSPGLRGTATSAAVRVETRNGTFIIEQRLRVYVECRVSTATSGLDRNAGGCSAHADIERAPKGKLDALCAMVDAHDLTKTPHEDDWARRVFQDLNQRTQQYDADLSRIAAAGRAQLARQSAILKKQSDDFLAASKSNHDAFMAQQESSFQSSMNNANASMNARSTAASDWVDYSLDQQTVVGQGGYAKVSSAYSSAWSSTTGNQTTWYQSSDPNTNPNGVLPGNWTQDTKVHGNGQPY
jgi:hypothetical protein